MALIPSWPLTGCCWPHPSRHTPCWRIVTPRPTDRAQRRGSGPTAGPILPERLWLAHSAYGDLVGPPNCAGRLGVNQLNDLSARLPRVRCESLQRHVAQTAQLPSYWPRAWESITERLTKVTHQKMPIIPYDANSTSSSTKCHVVGCLVMSLLNHGLLARYRQPLTARHFRPFEKVAQQ